MTDPTDVETARAAVRAAETAYDEAQTALRVAQDAVADVDDDVAVAQAKYEEYSADETKADWERIATHAELAKAQRRLERATDDAYGSETGAAQAEHHRDAVVAALESVLAAGDDDALAEDDAGGDGDLYFADVDAWVRGWLIPTWERRIDGQRADGASGFRWSARWWDHPEAVFRLEALWRAWEALRLDAGTGMSVWLRDHADHHMPLLLSKYGPFRRSEEAVPDGDPLPYAPPAYVRTDLAQETSSTVQPHDPQPVSSRLVHDNNTAGENG